MTPGTRIVLNEKSPWPERVGCEGIVVDPAIFEGKYPYDKRSKDLIVLLDADPLRSSRDNHDPRWTCVVERVDVSVVHGADS